MYPVTSTEMSSAAVTALQNAFGSGWRQTDRLLRLHTPLGVNVLLAEELKGVECLSGQSLIDGIHVITGYQLQIDALCLDGHLVSEAQFSGVIK